MLAYAAYAHQLASTGTAKPAEAAPKNNSAWIGYAAHAANLAANAPVQV